MAEVAETLMTEEEEAVTATTAGRAAGAAGARRPPRRRRPQTLFSDPPVSRRVFDAVSEEICVTLLKSVVSVIRSND